MALTRNTATIQRYNVDMAGVFAELDAAYFTTLNKLAMDGRLKRRRAQAAAPADEEKGDAGDADGPMLDCLLSLPPPPAPPRPPARGTVGIPPHNFAENFSRVCFRSLLTKPEVIRAMKGLRFECNKMLDQRMFKTNLRKAVTYVEFESSQEQANTNCTRYLRETWSTNVKSSIESELGDSGKGWFNLAETDYQVYNLSKLKNLLSYCDYMMRDSLRFQLDASVQEFTAFIEEACACETDVRSSHEVEVTWRSDRQSALFVVDLQKVGEGEDAEFGFSTAVAEFRKLCLRLFDAALTGTMNMPRIDRLVLHRPSQKNFWGSAKPAIDSVSPVEDWVQACRARVLQALDSSAEPMSIYLAMYEKHVAFLCLDPDHYLAEVEWKHAGGPNPNKRSGGSGSDDGSDDDYDD